MWIARNKDRSIALYNIKPIRAEYFWYADTRDTYDCLPIDKGLFPNLTWEDEPIEVSLVLSTPISEEELNKLAEDTKQYDDGDKILYKTPGEFYEAKDLDVAFKAGYRKRNGLRV